MKALGEYKWWNQYAKSELARFIKRHQWENLTPNEILNGPTMTTPGNWVEVAKFAYILGRRHGYDQGFKMGQTLSEKSAQHRISIATTQRCPECGLGAVEEIYDYTGDYACWGGEPTDGYRCPNGHEWTDVTIEEAS